MSPSGKAISLIRKSTLHGRVWNDKAWSWLLTVWGHEVDWETCSTVMHKVQWGRIEQAIMKSIKGLGHEVGWERVETLKNKLLKSSKGGGLEVELETYEQAWMGIWHACSEWGTKLMGNAHHKNIISATTHLEHHHHHHHHHHDKNVTSVTTSAWTSPPSSVIYRSVMLHLTIKICDVSSDN